MLTKDFYHDARNFEIFQSKYGQVHDWYMTGHDTNICKKAVFSIASNQLYFPIFRKRFLEKY